MGEKSQLFSDFSSDWKCSKYSSFPVLEVNGAQTLLQVIWELQRCWIKAGLERNRSAFFKKKKKKNLKFFSIPSHDSIIGPTKLTHIQDMWQVHSCELEETTTRSESYNLVFFFWEHFSFRACWGQIKYSGFIPASRRHSGWIFFSECTTLPFTPCISISHTFHQHPRFSATNMQRSPLRATDNLYEAATPFRVFITQSDGVFIPFFSFNWSSFRREGF